MFEDLLHFLSDLEEQNIWYRLMHVRTDAVMVELYLPGQHWEVEFFSDGHLEIEVFKSEGEIHDKSKLAELYTNHFESTPRSPLFGADSTVEKRIESSE